MATTTRTARIKLGEAAWRHTADPRDGRLWHAVSLRRAAQDYQPTEADHQRFLELYGVICGEVKGRLASGEWVAWGWRQGDTTPSKIPIELFERGDIKIDPERDTIRCAVCAFDNVTVDVSMTGVPCVAPAKKIKAPAVISAAFRKWTGTLTEWPTRRQVIDFARDGNYLQRVVLELYNAGPKRERGRPSKTDNGLK